jgi:hypothetical protein
VTTASGQRDLTTQPSGYVVALHEIENNRIFNELIRDTVLKNE